MFSRFFWINQQMDWNMGKEQQLKENSFSLQWKLNICLGKQTKPNQPTWNPNTLNNCFIQKFKMVSFLYHEA